MKSLVVIATTLFPEPGRAGRANRPTSILGSCVALGCALAPFVAVIGAYVQTA